MRNKIFYRVGNFVEAGLLICAIYKFGNEYWELQKFLSHAKVTESTANDGELLATQYKEALLEGKDTSELKRRLSEWGKRSRDVADISKKLCSDK